ncbi:hypothetical protein BU23DRAFT_653690 [Bimuria novae-zelandiae CBS 107.79]|uniref:Uncharacterized protein n=1 Tax=Bimuria novae-zelandiae CBS 107.79 TaxID=1447943 RepID=A0A6A5V7F0_9PLEO|nr:hypothetical protein BU23DRAFT_653690 [Bimuria novae-zelandiae CBS 107.79]
MMRVSTHWILAATPNLGASAPVANVVCDAGSDLAAHNISTITTIEHTGSLAGELKACIERVCSNGEDGDSSKFEQCESVTLALFSHDGPLPGIATCVDQLSRIADQCITNEGVVTGMITTDKAFFEIYKPAPELSSRQLSAEELKELEVDDEEDLTLDKVWDNEDLQDDEPEEDEEGEEAGEGPD